MLPVPDEPDVASMAAAVEPAVGALSRPRVVVGTSLGAMVALEVARRIDVDALVLIAAGFGISVADSVLDWVASNPPDLLEKMARIGLAGSRQPAARRDPARGLHGARSAVASEPPSGARGVPPRTARASPADVRAVG